MRAGTRPALRRFLDVLPRPLRRQKLLSALWRLGVVSPVQLLDFNGNARAWVDLRDAESRAVYLSQSFWPEFPPMVAAFLHDGGDFFDVGANFGLVTFGTLPLVQGSGTRFHLFEANRKIVPILERSAGEWPAERLEITHCCVSDEPGVSYHLLPDASWGHGLIADHGDPVTNLRLDDYIAERKIERIPFLKLDVEGWEIHALEGTRQAIAAGKVEAAFIEVAPDALRRTGAEAGDLLALLASLDFDVYFASLWDAEDPHRLRWTRVPVNGTSLRFAPASPLPVTFVQGDVLVLHRSTPLASAVRSAIG
ncbi:MAG TPA: FkbM family methyltransferase [Thermoanaerobaculia bacterium]|nr:FkbM family methyltransferase [Thermoanaerobaculia bacterium]